MSRRRSPGERRVVLRRCEDPAEAELWADAFRRVLASLEITTWWRVTTSPADSGAINVAADYQPALPEQTTRSYG